MVNIRAPFRIFAALTSPLTMSAAHAQALRTRASGVGDDVPSGAAETHADNTRLCGNGRVSTVTAAGVMSNKFGPQ